MPIPLSSNVPIICFSTTDWNEVWGSRQQLMSRLAQRGHPVLFIERQVGPEHLLRDPALRKRKLTAWRAAHMRQEKENLWLWQPPLLPAGRYQSVILNRIGQNILAKQVRKLQKSLGILNPILWLYPPQSAPLLGKFDERLSVYHCIENFSGNQVGIKRKVMQFEERQLLQNVDLVFTHSEGLLQLYEGLTRRKITLIPSAADVSFLQAATKGDPAITQFPYPRLGVIGTLDARLDLDLLENISHSHSNWHIIIIGQWHPERIDLKPLLKYPNVHYLGPQPYEKLPSLLYSLDVLLIPYAINEMTRYISPIKLYEYLAVGKPIITTSLPEVFCLKNHIRIAEDSKEFISHIKQALTNDTQADQFARRQLAKQHSWDQRLDVILDVITSALNEK